MTIQIASNLSISLERPRIMGILNYTSDSFYDGGYYNSEKHLIQKAKKMIDEGVDIIDIGVVSTRPYASKVTFEEEKKRMMFVLPLIKKHFPYTILSIDTYRAEIAKIAILEGAHIINDISAGSLDKEMYHTVANLNVPYIMMHMQGTPQNMQENPNYENVVKSVQTYFKRKIQKAEEIGIKQIILDPGFGFGKAIEHNFQLLKNLQKLKNFDLPILAGLSRKSMLFKTIKTSPEKALNATTAANIMALINGADILRVHDVKEALEAILLYEAYKIA